MHRREDSRRHEPQWWVEVLRRVGWVATHWSAEGDPRAADEVLFQWAVAHSHVVFTHDLDFSAMLALTHATGPSVLQVRTQDVSVEHLAPTVIKALRQFELSLEAGALVVVDEMKSRVRLLPLMPRD